MRWLLWGLLLVLQNATFTWVSRARNSGSIKYHAVASLFSNSTWFASQLLLIESLVPVALSADWQTAAIIGGFYTVCTCAGAVAAHWFAMKYLETGKRRVGATCT